MLSKIIACSAAIANLVTAQELPFLGEPFLQDVTDAPTMEDTDEKFVGAYFPNWG